MSALEAALMTLRRSDCRITAARRTVLEALAADSGHMTAPDLVTAVHARAPQIGRASVYRALELLTRLGVVQASTLGGGSATYMLAPAGHHHHLVCRVCGRTIEFDECALGEIAGRLAAALGFQIEGHLVEVYGRCAECCPAGSQPGSASV